MYGAARELRGLLLIGTVLRRALIFLAMHAGTAACDVRAAWMPWHLGGRTRAPHFGWSEWMGSGASPVLGLANNSMGIRRQAK